jgi:hypothetical protein
LEYDEEKIEKGIAGIPEGGIPAILVRVNQFDPTADVRLVTNAAP